MIINEKSKTTNKNIIIYNKSKINLKGKNQPKINIKESEINYFSFNEALESDKRTFYQYYSSLIKTKVIIFFSFYPIDDYNIKIIKVCLFFLFFVIYLAVNTFFFNDNTIHQIYKDGGKYNFICFLPQIIYSFIICYITTTIIQYFSLSEKDLLGIKIVEKHDERIKKAEKVKTCLLIKYIIFYILSIIFLSFFWFYLSSFCAVYNNTQVYLIINAFICCFISMIYKIIFNLLPAIFRIISLEKNTSTNRTIFNISKFMQII